MPRPFRSFSRGQHTHVLHCTSTTTRLHGDCKIQISTDCEWHVHSAPSIPIQLQISLLQTCGRKKNKDLDFIPVVKRQKKKIFQTSYRKEKTLQTLDRFQRRLTCDCEPQSQGSWQSPFVQLLTLFNAISTKGHANCRSKKECPSCPFRWQCPISWKSRKKPSHPQDHSIN